MQYRIFLCELPIPSVVISNRIISLAGALITLGVLEITHKYPILQHWRKYVLKLFGSVLTQLPTILAVYIPLQGKTNARFNLTNMHWSLWFTILLQAQLQPRPRTRLVTMCISSYTDPRCWLRLYTSAILSCKLILMMFWLFSTDINDSSFIITSHWVTKIYNTIFAWPVYCTKINGII